MRAPSLEASDPLGGRRGIKDRRALAEHWLPLVLLVGVLAFGFQGSRSIWEPDEGFYVNVALGMLNTGDWVIPRLSDEPFLDKPPLLYWGAALGMKILGKNEWGARVPHALWFSGTVLLVGLLGKHLLGKGQGRLAAVVYCTSLLPFVGSNALTPDTLLAFCCALALLCYCRALGNTERARWRLAWWLAFGAATGLGALAKGPAVFLFVFPLAIHYLWLKGLRRAILDPKPYAAALIAAVIALPWYAAVASQLPGAASYFFDNEVAGRLMTARYRRNSGSILSGALYYVPVLVIGGLPWSVTAWPFLFKGVRIRGRIKGALRRIADGPGDSPFALLALSILIPLVVLLAAQSRLPLYVLPLFVPLALATASGVGSGLRQPASGRRRIVVAGLFVAWAFALIGIKAGAAFLSTDRSTSSYAAALDRVVESHDAEIVAVDLKLHGLPLYGYTDFESVTTEKITYPFFATLEGLAFEAKEMELESEREPHLFIVPSSKFDEVSRALYRTAQPCRVVGEVHTSVLLYCPSRAAAQG